MMHPLELAASAIATIEGFYASDPSVAPRKNHNPGDLRASPLQRPKSASGFAIFQCDAEGTAALVHQLMLMACRGLTWRQAITLWAPVADHNNTALYLERFATLTKLNLDVRIWDCIHIEHLA